MSKARIVKNAVIFFLQSLLSLVISVFINGYIAKKLGTEQYGIFVFAFSFATMFTIFSDMGFHGWGVKRIVKSKEKTAEYLGDIFVARTFFSIITYTVIIVAANVIDYPAITRNAIYIAATSVILVNTLFTNCWIVFEAHESVKFEGISNVGCRIIVALLSFYLMYNNYGVIALAWVYLSGGLFQVAYCFYILKRRFSLPVIQFSVQKYYRQTREALPFAFLSFFFIIYYEVDKIMLGMMQSDSAVGLYNAAASIAYRAAIISSAISVATMPAMIQRFKERREKLTEFIKKFLPILLVLGIPIASCGVIYAKNIVDIIYHSRQYYPSIITIKIIVWMIPLEFISHFFRFALIASEKEKIPALIVGSAVGFNLLLNAFLITYYSYNGAAFATVLTETFLVVAMMLYYHKKIDKLPLPKSIFGVILANMVFFLCLYRLVAGNWSFFALIPCGVLYTVLLFLFRVIGREELSLLRMKK